MTLVVILQSCGSFFREKEVERLFLPFIALQELAEAACVAEWESTSLREVITAGEQLKVTPAVQRFFDRLSVTILENQYGPTECHVVTAHRLQATPKEWPLLPPIGKPSGMTRYMSLTRTTLLCPLEFPVACIWLALEWREAI